MKRKLTWTPAKVGCYWSAGLFFISTRILVQDGKMVMTYPQSGYVLRCDRQELGIFKTLKAAQRAAQKAQVVG